MSVLTDLMLDSAVFASLGLTSTPFLYLGLENVTTLAFSAALALQKKMMATPNIKTMKIKTKIIVLLFFFSCSSFEASSSIFKGEEP
jgi:hypothetical protein